MPIVLLKCKWKWKSKAWIKWMESALIWYWNKVRSKSTNAIFEMRPITLLQLNKSVCRMWCYGPNSIKINQTAPVNSIRINRFEWFSAIDLHRVYHPYKDPKAIPFHGKINLGPTNTFRFVRQVQWLNSIQNEFKCYLFRMKRQKMEFSFVLLFRHLQMKW